MKRLALYALQLLVASVSAAGVAGMLVLFFMMMAGMLTQTFNPVVLIAGAAASFFLITVAGGLAVFPAIATASVPTFFLGGLLWHMGRHRPSMRAAWFAALAGGLSGAAAYLGVAASGAFSDLIGTQGFPGPTLLVVFTLAGAGAGLFFRAAMYGIGQFFGDDGEPDGESGVA